MGYQQALLRRWSRRDRLAVLVIAVTVAFPTGATVLLFAVGAQTASVAAKFDTPSPYQADAVPGHARPPEGTVTERRCVPITTG